MLRIAWTDKVTNEEVLRRAGLKRELMRCIEKRQLQFLGHILRAQGLESDCSLVTINGRRAKGRQRKKYMDCLMESWGGRYKAVELVQSKVKQMFCTAKL